MRVIPKVPKHDRALYPDGGNNKEYCKCEKCKEIRKRRDNIYKCKILKLWMKN